MGKRDVMAGDFDRTFDMFGVHVGLKYIDPSNKLMGGKLAVKIDDLKAMIPRAQSKKVEVEVNFDGHELPLFKAFVNYAMVHADGDGEEKGSFTMERKHVGDMWVTNIKTSTAGSALTGGAPIIPAMISNAEIELESDWMTKLNAKYINPTRNRNIVLHVVRVPGESINLELVSGDMKFELNLSVKDFDLRKADGNFEFKATGSTPAGPFEGFVQGVNDNGTYKVKIEFNKGGKKLLQISTQNKFDLANQRFSTKLKWSLMGGASQGEMKIQLVNSELNTKVKVGDVDLEFRAKIIPGELADIEGKKNGMTEAKVSIDHQPGEKLEVVTNFEKFKGFKIAKTGNGNERVIEINGRQLAKGDYTLTDQSFSTKVTLEDGSFLEPKITWVGALPNNRAEAVEFFLKNHFKIKVTGSRRNLNLDLNWKMTKPDFDFSTPENGKVSEAKIVGESQFESGILATATPIQTDVAFKFLMNDRDLIGHFKKVINGKEFSVDFPEGFGTLPKIKLGQ